jgi:hypothetical protein
MAVTYTPKIQWPDNGRTIERARRRDAPEEYAKVQDRIDTLRVKQINR